MHIVTSIRLIEHYKLRNIQKRIGVKEYDVIREFLKIVKSVVRGNEEMIKEEAWINLRNKKRS